MKNLGYRQKFMLNCMDNTDKRYSIQDCNDQRRVAKSLEKRGLIKIVNQNWGCWIIKKL